MCTPSAGAPSWVVHDILKVERIGLMEVKVGEKGDGNKTNAKGPTPFDSKHAAIATTNETGIALDCNRHDIAVLVVSRLLLNQTFHGQI